jgi:hypothetical protein
MSSHTHRDWLRTRLAAKRAEAERLRVKLDVARDAYHEAINVIIGLEAELYTAERDPGAA